MNTRTPRHLIEAGALLALLAATSGAILTDLYRQLVGAHILPVAIALQTPAAYLLIRVLRCWARGFNPYDHQAHLDQEQ